MRKHYNKTISKSRRTSDWNTASTKYTCDTFVNRGNAGLFVLFFLTLCARDDVLQVMSLPMQKERMCAGPRGGPLCTAPWGARCVSSRTQHAHRAFALNLLLVGTMYLRHWRSDGHTAVTLLRKVGHIGFCGPLLWMACPRGRTGGGPSAVWGQMPLVFGSGAVYGLHLSPGGVCTRSTCFREKRPLH